MQSEGWKSTLLEWQLEPKDEHSPKLTRADKITAEPKAEVMKHAVPVLLVHPGVYVKAGVAQLRDLLGQQLNSRRRVTEYYGLVYLELKANNTDNQ